MKSECVEYMELHHMCDDGVELVCHVEYDSSTGKIKSIMPFYIDEHARNNVTVIKYSGIKERLTACYEAVEMSAHDCVREAMGARSVYNPWISRSVRVPELHDADPYNHVIAWDAVHKQAILVFPEYVQNRKYLTHWKRTLLDKEPPPI